MMMLLLKIIYIYFEKLNLAIKKAMVKREIIQIQEVIQIY